MQTNYVPHMTVCDYTMYAWRHTAVNIKAFQVGGALAAYYAATAQVLVKDVIGVSEDAATCTCAWHTAYVEGVGTVLHQVVP